MHLSLSPVIRAYWIFELIKPILVYDGSAPRQLRSGERARRWKITTRRSQLEPAGEVSRAKVKGWPTPRTTTGEEQGGGRRASYSFPGKGGGGFVIGWRSLESAIRPKSS